MRCYICKNPDLRPLFSLGHQPPSDAFLTKEALGLPETTYPMDLFFCRTCRLVQLGYAVDPEVLFTDYVYATGNNNSLRTNFHALAKNVVTRFGLTARDLAIDIGSNDGTLLEGYLPSHIRVLGIDPSSVTALAIQKRIPTLREFFTKETADRVQKEYGKAKVITGTNVFAHVKDLDSFMEGVALLLADDGVFIQESHYLLDLMTHMQYDSIYHEHLRYYSLLALKELFTKWGLTLFSAERISTHGGSLRTYAARTGAYPEDPTVEQILAVERKEGLEKEATYRAFGEKIKTHRNALIELLYGLKKSQKRIVGIGAPAKGNTLLNYCKFDSDSIAYLTEKSPLKIGLFAPGNHIPVVDEALLFEEQPDYALVLSWNIADELIPKLRNAGFRNKFIIPNPQPRIID